MTIFQGNKEALNVTLISRGHGVWLSIRALGSSSFLIAPLLSVALTAPAVDGVILGSIPHPAG